MSIEKMNALQVSHIRIDESSSDDKLKLSKNSAKLFILKRLTETKIINDGKMLMIANDGELDLFQVKRNITKEARSDLVWRHINQCSRFNAEWENIFH